MGIQARFKKDLTVYDLFDRDIYRTLESLFLEAYNAIPKFGRQCYFNRVVQKLQFLNKFRLKGLVR
jgi:hypothetical protein